MLGKNIGLINFLFSDLKLNIKDLA